MKNKIVSLSKNEDFKSILSGKKISNKYLTIFFKKLSDKNNNRLNIRERINFLCDKNSFHEIGKISGILLDNLGRLFRGEMQLLNQII